jgi:hypothetical protein
MSLYLIILFEQLYMFRAFLTHPQEFLHCMVSRSLWQMCGCVVVWLGIRWLVWCDPSSYPLLSKIFGSCWSLWPRGLRRNWQPHIFWNYGFDFRRGHGYLSLSFECYALSGRGLCDGPMFLPVVKRSHIECVCACVRATVCDVVQQ